MTSTMTHTHPLVSSVPTDASVRILLVDDQPENLLVLEGILETPGYELVKAGSGADALRHLLQAQFAVIVLDVLMPGMDGFETAKLIKQRERTRLVPIIFLTAYGTNELNITEGYAAGAVDFLSKPTDPQILRSKVAVFVEMYKQQEQLRVLNAALSVSQRELRDANHHLASLVEQLRESNASLDSFAYSISHDLRAPLRHAEGFSSILARTWLDKLDDDEKRYLTLMRGSITRMNAMVEDLLAFARVSRKDLQQRQVDMQTLVNEAYQEQLAGTSGREIEFVLHPLPPVQGDTSMLRQVWVNLLSNAVKYTRNRKDARIEVGSYPVEGGNAYFVKDNGAGFDMHHAEKLFGVFQRMHTEREFEGTGAGLAIVKRIVQRHGGQIRAEAAVGQGATFTFTLPIESPDYTAADAPASTLTVSPLTYEASGESRNATTSDTSR